MIQQLIEHYQATSKKVEACETMEEVQKVLADTKTDYGVSDCADSLGFDIRDQDWFTQELDRGSFFSRPANETTIEGVLTFLNGVIKKLEKINS